MRNLIDFVKDKIYYIMAATILLVIVLIAINACSGISTKTYDSIENDMVNAAKKYYSSRKDKLPSEINETISVTTGTLIEAELLEEIVDPNKKENKCQGYVQVKKLDDGYVYTPFLSCKGSYEPKYLSDVVKESGTDEYGNGVYLMDNEYVYRGDDVNNYVLFANKLWRIVMIDSEGDIELVLNEATENKYTWETSFNVEEQDNVGVNTNYFNSNIRKTLLRFYEQSFDEKEKAKIVPKDLCIGALGKNENFNREKECYKKQEGEYIGLLRVSDYKRATLDDTCLNRKNGQCRNHNYLVKSADIDSWLLNTVEENTYEVFTGYGISYEDAAEAESLNPVIYLSKDVIMTEGSGKENSPYFVK